MYSSALLVALTGLLSSKAFAAPAEKRATTSTNAYSSASASLATVSATTSPTAVAQAISSLSSIFEASPTPASLYVAIGDIVREGLAPGDVESVIDDVVGTLTGENSEVNVNIEVPDKTVYPKASSSDAPYSLTEAQLREVIYIPSTFKYGVSGAPQPVILVPGTGATGYTTFEGNFIPLLTGSSFADPVWLNIPGYLLNDAQVNSEYIAYAINYISAISHNRNVSVIGWSQGNIDTQWAFKYWPSTRKITSDHVAISPDYHGTVLANFIEPGNAVPLPPAVLQQEYNSNYITTLRSNNGDSAYVPTTTVYSGFFDEIVEPQQGTGASAYLLDARNVGVTNNEVQLICPSQAAGSFYTHEGVLYNPLAFALAEDALTHAGPGEVSRISTSTLCPEYITSGLNLADLLITENSIVIAGVAILVYPSKTTVEPAIMGKSLSVTLE